MTKFERQQLVKSVSEIERRYRVGEYDRNILRSKSVFIEQGYFDKTRDLRVRIINGKTAVLTRKTGRGLKRHEENERIGLKAARFELESTPYVIQKRRYFKNGWEVDFFEGPLTGLVLAEFEMKKTSQIVVVPPWLRDVTEVTETLSNRLLAHVAYDLTCEADGERRPIKDYLPKKVPSIVITGPPCSGKSTIMTLWRAEFGKILHCVPETATIIIDTVGVKPPFGDSAAMRDFQRTIYRVQHSFEKAAHRQAFNDGKTALLLDRGTVDGAAYMPRGLPDLERICETSVAEEYARYDGVICLDLPPRAAYEQNCKNNPARTETYDQAKTLGEHIVKVYSGHPNFHFVRGNTVEEKVIGAHKAFMECTKRRAA